MPFTGDLFKGSFRLLPHAERIRQIFCAAAALTLVLIAAQVARAGPPYLSDDPEPTDYEHYEIYAFANSEVGDNGSGGEAGIDFNYGAAPDLQLTAVLPLGYAQPSGGQAAVNLGNIELAAKFRVLHQNDAGWDVAVFPRLLLPSGSAQVGERHASFLLPIWFGKDLNDGWSTFGGGGCVLNHGGDSRNYCLGGWAVTNQVTPQLQLGAEMFHQSADTRDEKATTILGAGAKYDLSDNYHLLGYIGSNLQSTADTRYTWYASFLFTF